MKRRRRVLWMQSWNVPVVGTLLHIKTLENKCKQCDIHITRGKELHDKRPNWCVLHNDTLNPAGAFCCCCSGWRKQPHTPGTNTLRSWTGLLLMTLLDKNQQGRKKQWLHLTAPRKCLVFIDSKENPTGMKTQQPSFPCWCRVGGTAAPQGSCPTAVPKGVIALCRLSINVRYQG